jgi:hypothetical protein
VGATTPSLRLPAIAGAEIPIGDTAVAPKVNTNKAAFFERQRDELDINNYSFK